MDKLPGANPTPVDNVVEYKVEAMFISERDVNGPVDDMHSSHSQTFIGWHIDWHI